MIMISYGRKSEIEDKEREQGHKSYSDTQREKEMYTDISKGRISRIIFSSVALKTWSLKIC